MPIYPITFCIPEELVIRDIDTILKNKKIFEAFYKPGQPYAFSNPTEYYKMYEDSAFGHTKKKGGWDCFRHLEILAKGCLPVFENIETIPEHVMKFYPKDLMLQASNLYYRCKQNNYIMTLEDKSLYDFLVRHAIKHTRKHLTTGAMAKYILNTVFGKENKNNVTSVLYLSAFDHIDFQRCLLLHGFKSLFGVKCVDVCRVGHLYQSYDVEKLHKSGAGFGFTGLLPDEYDICCNRENIAERIIAKEFDVIIYGSIHRGLPYIDTVLSCYPSDRIVYIDGEDCTPLFTGENHDSCCELKGFGKKGHLFIREYSGLGG